MPTHLVGPPHGHDHYSMSPGVASHMDGHLGPNQTQALPPMSSFRGGNTTTGPQGPGPQGQGSPASNLYGNPQMTGGPPPPPPGHPHSQHNQQHTHPSSGQHTVVHPSHNHPHNHQHSQHSPALTQGDTLVGKALQTVSFFTFISRIVSKLIFSAF